MPEISSKQQNFETILTSGFNITSFVDIFVREFLNGVVVYNGAKNLRMESRLGFQDFVEGFFNIGNFETSQREQMAVLAVRLKSNSNVERARSKQRDYIKQILKDSRKDAALVAFYVESDSKWRLSFVRLDSTFIAGKFKDELTPAKRYSYLVGDNEPCHTAKEYLYPIYNEESNKPSLDDLEKAFSVEKVTDDFFALYKEKFLQLQEALEKIPAFVAEAQRCNFTSEQFAKKLMGQLVFLYFIQKKGWLGVRSFPLVLSANIDKYDYIIAHSKDVLQKTAFQKAYQKGVDGKYHRNSDGIVELTETEGKVLAQVVNGESWGTGPKNFVRRIFEQCIKEHKNFMDDYLEPFFYEGLNNDREQDKYYYHNLRCRIPFLNGGLFEPLKHYRWENNDFAVPNELFSNAATKGERDADGILDIFDRFNFTMNEDEPMEKEVAIDPEMLGKVFENLLEIKDRKSKGAFYTPREIVHYMCQESLINYLTGKMAIPEYDIRDFVLYGDFMKDEDTKYDVIKDKKDMYISAKIFDRKKGVNRLAELDKYLVEVKICDPAVGSGAFPLGMINEIVKLRDVVTSYLVSTIDIVDETIPVEDVRQNAFLKQALEKRDKILSERNLYALKKDAIGNSIFACDLEASAVDIAKLRLWLALIIDETAHSNYPPRTLPNLDCQIICGNSLVDEFFGIKLGGENIVPGFNGGRTALDFNGTEKTVQELVELQSKLYYTKRKDYKQKYRDRIKEIYAKFMDKALEVSPQARSMYYKIVEDDLPLPFVVWQLFFPRVFVENGGFDIVIGNPPYGAKISAAEKEYYKKTYKCSQTINDKKYPVRNQKGSTDTFAVFIEKGLSLLRKDGVLAFIVPMSLISSDAMTGLQKIIEGNCKTAYISSYSNRPKQIFDAACIRTSIAILHYTKTALSDLYMSKLQRRSEKMSIRQIIQNLKYVDSRNLCLYGRYPKIGSQEEYNILSKLMSRDRNVMSYIDDSCSKGVYYRAAGGRYYNVITDYSTGSSQEKLLHMNDNNAFLVGLFLSSSFFWFYQQAYTDGLHIKQNEIDVFPLPDLDSIPAEKKEYVAKLYNEYEADLERNVVVHQSNSYNVSSYKEYKIGKSQRYVDLIDDITGELYGFTKEETEFIKNYEREFRVRDEE